MAEPHVHDFRLHPEHRQGDIVLGDGARVFTCTKQLREGARTAMLLVPGLLRVDVTGRGDEFEIRTRNLTGGALSSDLGETVTHRRASSFEGVEQVVSEFSFAPAAGPVGQVRVSITRPAADRGERFPCTAIAIVSRR
jgi:hypothetical protein